MALIERGRPGEGPRDGPGGRRGGPGRGRGVLALLAVAAFALAWWWLGREGEAPAPAAPSGSETADLSYEPELAPVAPASEPTAEPAPEAPAVPPLPPAPAPPPLPPLAASDPLARELAADVSAHRLVARLLAVSGVIDRFVLVVDNLAEGLVPRRPLAPLAPSGGFLTTGEGDELRIDPASYGRFDPVVAAIASLDASAAAAAYRRLAPLCEQSYRALGYPEGGFEGRLRTALALLLATPEPGDEPRLVPETLRYEFADPALESLSDAQKLLLRLGPTHGARVRAKLREIEAALGPTGSGG